MQVILMPGMQDESKIARLESSDQRSVMHHFGDIRQALGDANAVHARWNRLERRIDRLGFHTALERRVFLGVPGFGTRLAARHPEKHETIGRRRQLLGLLGPSKDAIVHKSRPRGTTRANKIPPRHRDHSGTRFVVHRPYTSEFGAVYFILFVIL